MKTLGILDCDELAPGLIDDYIDYTSMFETLMKPVLTSWHFKPYKVIDKHLAGDIDECDAYLITGSKTGVYDDEPWLPDLRAVIAHLYGLGIPLVGICFGHQLLADTLGGRAEKSEKGWGIGLKTTSLHEAAVAKFSPNKPNINLLYSHQDQVTALPSDATLIMSSEFCPNAAYMIGSRVLSFQGHPEFTHDYSRRLMSTRRDRYPEMLYDEAVASLQYEADSDLIARWIGQFLEDATLKQRK